MYNDTLRRSFFTEKKGLLKGVVLPDKRGRRGTGNTSNLIVISRKSLINRAKNIAKPNMAK
jgi:hypothetical protein